MTPPPPPPPPPITTKTKTTTITNNNSNKKLKYENLCIDIQRMWNLEFMIILVIIGATRLATKCLRKYLEMIPGKQICYKRQLYLEHHS